MKKGWTRNEYLGALRLDLAGDFRDSMVILRSNFFLKLSDLQSKRKTHPQQTDARGWRKSPQVFTPF